MKSKNENQSINQYIIQIERPGQPVTMDEARSLLEPLGVKLDPSYGPIPVNPKTGCYVFRGMATEDIRESAQKLEGVKFFGDVKIEPTQYKAGQSKYSS
jgi:hypothetical protein